MALGGRVKLEVPKGGDLPLAGGTMTTKSVQFNNAICQASIAVKKYNRPPK
jgi:hypothetical protein